MFPIGGVKDAEMAFICNKGKPHRRRLPIICLLVVGLISFVMMLHANISLPSSRDISRNVDGMARKYNMLSLESSEVIIHGHGPSADDYLDDARSVKISENRFHYKPHREIELAILSGETTTRDLVESTTEFDRLLVTNVSPHQTEKAMPNVRNGSKIYDKLDIGGGKPPTPTPKPSILQHKRAGSIYRTPPKKTTTPKRYSRDPKGLERYKKYLAAKEQPLPEQKNAVIILTNHRSGSSFFGELFNQHPDAFSLFEPLFPLSNRSECDKNLELKVKLLNDFVRCRMPDWIEIYKGIPPFQRVRNNENLRLCMATGMCFRMHTKELCEDRHCPRTSDKSVRSCMYDCGRLNLGLVENECRKKKVVAAKLIRLCDILDLESILKSAGSNVKVLHLLRDPRGIANSRHAIESKLNLQDSLNRTCQRQSHNLLTGASETPDWLKGKYMAVRYEDTALYPYKTAQSVYDFVGLDFPNVMKEWIAKNTAIHTDKIDDSHGEHKAIKDHVEVPKRAKRMDPYSTKRNATATVQKWARRLLYPTVLQIESVCLDIMKMAGYVKVGTQQQYNDRGRLFFKDNIPILDDQNRT